MYYFIFMMYELCLFTDDAGATSEPYLFVQSMVFNCIFI